MAKSKIWFPFVIFIVAFFLVPIAHLDLLKSMPGDIGDARLNNYFLENIFQYLVGNVNSLWHFTFFSPFPYVVGFSDNHFGSSPAYLLARLLGGDPETAFQAWFLFGYATNFAAAYYALRRLNGSVLAASVGALIFAFALPTTAHAGHAQLHYRFGLPLAIVFLSDFYKSTSWRYLVVAGAWLVWQFYSGIYIGFFTLLLLAAMSLTFFGSTLFSRQASVKNFFNKFVLNWRLQSKRQKIFVLGCFLILLLLLLLLFYPYLQVAHLYGATRSWPEISSMLPRPQSYFLADASFLWSRPDLKIFASLPMRHEHQMFIGLAPLVLAFIGLFLGNRSKNGSVFTFMAGMLGIVIIFTLNVGGFSLWYFLHKLPLFSAIRAVTRLDQAILFPVAYLAGIAIDYLKCRFAWGAKVVLILILPVIIFEAGMTSMKVSAKELWRQRITDLEASLPVNLPDNSILFFAQRNGPPYADELDAMWVSLRRNVGTINGYSGMVPPGYLSNFQSDCSELPRRVLSYLKFSGQEGDLDYYREYMSRVLTIGFTNCDQAWLDHPPLTSSKQVYTADEFGYISYSNGELLQNNGLPVIRININNSSRVVFSAESSVDKPIRLSWRFLDESGQPLSGWDNRKDLPLDIPAQGSLRVDIPLSFSSLGSARSVQVSLVQENVFWAHDVGVHPITIPIK